MSNIFRDSITKPDLDAVVEDADVRGRKVISISNIFYKMTENIFRMKRNFNGRYIKTRRSTFY
jgi:hypothetical protein